MDDDEINELRDVFVKVYKNALDKTLKKHFSLKHSKLEDYYKLDKNIFSLYKFDTFIMANSDKVQAFIEELNSLVKKDFKFTYEKRIKNRLYGKTKEQELDKNEESIDI